MKVSELDNQYQVSAMINMRMLAVLDECGNETMYEGSSPDMTDSC